MSYFAAAAVRGSTGWSASELDLAGVADIEEVADRLRDVAPDASVSLLFVESDDAYLVILRLDDGEDLRVFGSDSLFADESRLGALLLADIKEPALEVDDAAGPLVSTGVVGDEVAGDEVAAADDDDGDDGDDEPAAEPEIDPVGDPDLLADLGVPSHRLLELCARDGMLPSDVTAEVCAAIGCGDEVEELRDA